ncbi:hypothetical protein SmJEL517_g01471 [Synchytrium microbalum]|uniref:Uncharacterized protein n=1 Tax=Synchytrium microbalum TaxID=1806994 RepID=A0A507CDK4_9FUNG|nr:uncharacterized protein SmJEL517_g01471 [Synchytrium microbalum]TPX36126.1 hypothetical protein SmJEL517_g01471 [Synchytrium microbalum]
MLNPLSNPKGYPIYAMDLVASPSERLPARKHCPSILTLISLFQDNLFPANYVENSTEHRDLDYKSIHDRVCPLISSLKRISNRPGSEEERMENARQVKALKTQIYEKSTERAKTWLAQQKFDLVIPAASQSLRLALALFSQDGSLEVVTSRLILGEACCGMTQYAACEEHLSQARWAMTKSGSTDPSTRARLHRATAALYAAKGDRTKAIEELASEIYYLGLSYGPDSPYCGDALSRLGTAFEGLAKPDAAFASHVMATTCWNQDFSKGFDDALTSEGVHTLSSARDCFSKMGPSYVKQLQQADNLLEALLRTQSLRR